MACALCSTRKPRRYCPAVGREICPVCCGTKRLVEIACPADCVYLAAARHHPPAAVLRQRERDLQVALPMVQQLPEAAYHLLLVFQEVARRHRQGAIPPLLDADVVDAAATLAATLETAARGIIFEHQATSLTAQRLMREFREALGALERDAGPRLEREAALALRRIERAGREARTALGDSDTALLEFFDRSAPGGDPSEATGPAPEGPASRPATESRIIIP